MGADIRTRTLNEPGVKAVCLFVKPTNPTAVRVYGRIGFSGLETGVPEGNAEEWAHLAWEEVEMVKF
jgi:hypothetical protein